MMEGFSFVISTTDLNRPNAGKGGDIYKFIVIFQSEK
jgi:hypothetical protein